jgi:dihydrolipoamide dehydrogenase
MIGHGVSELIPILSVAIAGEMTEKELMAAVFPHPTMSEVIQDAVYAAFDVSINS